MEGATLAKLESEWNEADVRLIELNCNIDMIGNQAQVNISN